MRFIVIFFISHFYILYHKFLCNLKQLLFLITEYTIHFHSIESNDGVAYVSSEDWISFNMPLHLQKMES